jgi:hypothetical protein
MQTNDIMRRQVGRAIGYMPTSIGVTSLTDEYIRDCGLKLLRRLPPKITAYFHRDKIVSVHKSDYCADDRDNYYIITATDGTKFHVEY